MRHDGDLQADPDGLNLFAARFEYAGICPPYARVMEFAEIHISGFALAMPLNGGGTKLLLWAEGDVGFGAWDLILAFGRR